MVVAASHGRGLFYAEFNAETAQTGDLNGDQNINVLDVIILTNMILSGLEFSNLADLNSDQTLDILDIILLVNIILDN